ncbi:MAG: HAD family phosphatase [Ectothiorhodospiraceae bacterium]|nr:HAD family phosphatase [Ectothiorhodospiraceae bacterium]MCH8503195.1 HAD family phosphatase [Ectothiorhodospiraceae bacterium]
MTLAIFDLDNTLLAGDSDYLWGRFLVERGLVDPERYEATNRRFYHEYLDGTLDVHEFLRFALEPLSRHPAEQLHQWRQEFLEEKIRPIVLQPALDLVRDHAERGHTTMIITATNRFVTDPIAALFGVDHLLATTPELVDGRYTGRIADRPTFREGKVLALDDWLAARGQRPAQSWFYSDSHNDLPLLERVTNPVAVDPDDTLRQTAADRGWPTISLRDGSAGGPA